MSARNQAPAGRGAWTENVNVLPASLAVRLAETCCQPVVVAVTATAR